MGKILLIGFGGLLGTLARYWLSGWAAQRYGETFPSGTLLVNLLGCFLVGFGYHLLQERFLLDPAIRSFLLMGFLGGLTTFSSFGVQTFALLRDGEWWPSAVNVAASNFGGLLMIWAGYALSKFL